MTAQEKKELKVGFIVVAFVTGVCFVAHFAGLVAAFVTPWPGA